jgi:hypothetical protein
MGRGPKYHKAQAGLGATLAFGTWSAAGAAVTGAPSLVPFGLIVLAAGGFIYGTDVLVRVALGAPRPPAVVRVDAIVAGIAAAVGTIAGLAAPLYV